MWSVEVGSNPALVLLFFSLGEFYECIVGGHVKDFDFFLTIAIFWFRCHFHPCKSCKFSHAALTGTLVHVVYYKQKNQKNVKQIFQLELVVVEFTVYM